MSDRDAKPDNQDEPMSHVMDGRARKLARQTGVAAGWHEGDLRDGNTARFLAGCERCGWHLGTTAELPSLIEHGPEARRQGALRVERAVLQAFTREALRRGCGHVRAYRAAVTGQPPRPRPSERLCYAGKLLRPADRRLCDETGIAFGLTQHDELEQRMLGGCEVCGYLIRAHGAVNDQNREHVTAALRQQMDAAATQVLCEHWFQFSTRKWAE